MALEELSESVHGGDDGVAGRADRVLGDEADREAGDFEHREVVRAVADRDRSVHGYVEFGGVSLQRRVLRALDERPFHVAGESAALHGQAVRDDVVDFDAIETYNSWLFTGYKNRRARRFAAKRQYPGVAGSDAHRVGYVGRAYTEIDIPDVSRASLTADDILTAIRSGSTEVQGRRTPIPTSTKHYAGAAGRKSAYYAKRGALGSALLAKKGAFKSGYYAKLGALKSGSLAKTGVAQAARMLYRLSPLSR